ncbi:DUF4397 domain-containing protein [Mucilaginibacter sp. RB4R14]|uniref:DUF4397 domain-containing protein n=1 Tax=Mucilaginibacter aurantiaciroseus TaxID=2949308 RepID=UPI002090F1CE|nr:DUF4397 domain-containing protein [Mucilaginibacter aurantiaciroseus]MCO5934335.1 DUF4397 domain-containing protein [Mucilaginibacter aurantiaciroseus]
MANKNKSGILLGLSLVILGSLILPLIQSCSKTGVNASSGTNARLQIVNLSPDIQPFNLYAFFIKQGTVVYSYPNASGYFLVNSIDTPLQIRTSTTTNGINQINLLTLPGSLKAGVPYTWFVTGIRKDSALATILTVDTGSVPANGRGKVRFVNAAPSAINMNLSLNDTVAFKNIAYKKVTDFVEVTAGAFNFKVAATNAPLVVLAPVPNFTVLDGKLYTVYFYGLSNNTDSAKYNANILLNTLPVGTKY